MKTFEERRAEFVKKYQQLVDDLGVDYANYPVYYPNERGEFVLKVQSIPMDTKAGNKPFIERDVPKT